MVNTVFTKHIKREVVTISMYDHFYTTTITESSTQESTSAEGQVGAQSEETPDDDRSNPTLVPPTTGLIPNEAEATTVGEKSFGGNENETVRFTFAPTVFDQTTGSGIEPPQSEEDTTAPVGYSEEPQHTPENLPEHETTTPEFTDSKSKKNSYK